MTTANTPRYKGKQKKGGADSANVNGSIGLTITSGNFGRKYLVVS